MFINYVSRGYEPELFWEITPRYYSILMKAADKKEEHESNFAIYVGWMSGLVGNSAKPPKLEELLYSSSAKKTAEQEQDQLIFSLSMLSASQPAKTWDEWQEELAI